MTRCLTTVVLLFTLASSAWASEAPYVRAITPEGKILASAFDKPSGAIPIIVQFRDRPLFARGNTRKTLADRFATFERDLATIDRARVSANSTERASRIDERYSRVFAGAALTVSAETLAKIQQLDYVRSVHVDRTMHALLDRSVPKIKAPEVWATYGTRGSGAVVAILDTGIDYTHPAFGNGFGPGHRVIGGHDFINDDDDPMDDEGHGTHVAGIVGANGGGIVGVAPEVTFLAYKVLNENGSGAESKVIAGVERAVDPNGDGNPADHADIANLSLGGPGDPDDPLTQAVETATAAGVVFCVASGNDGIFHAINSPGNAPSAITVGATTIDDEMAAFSSRGPVGGTLAIKPDVVAPGVEINSAAPGGSSVALSGTSMATPHIAGVAALLRAIHRDWPVADIKAAIVGTAEPLDADVMEQGGGRVDAWRAAGADVVALPGVLSFGLCDANTPHWMTSAIVTLVNHGNAARTLTLQAPSPRAGVAIALDATSVTLAAGATREVRVSLDLDNALVPSPTEGSFSIGGEIEITGGAMPLHVPWAFVKGAVVTVDYDGPEAYAAFFTSTTGAASGHIFGDLAQHETTTLLPIGTYDVSVFPSPIVFTDGRQRIIVLEQQQLDGKKTVAVSRTNASLSVTPSAADERGASLESGDRECESVVALLPPHNASLPAIIVSADAGFLASPMSERMTLLPFARCIDTAHRSVYSAQFAPLRGITASQRPTIGAADWTRVPVRVRIPSTAIAPRVTLLTGWAWHDTNISSEAVGRGVPATGTWEGSIFLTQQQHELMSAMGFVTVQSDLYSDPQPAPRITTLVSPKIRRTVEGVEPWPYGTNAPTTYIAQPGELLEFGDGLTHLLLNMSMREGVATLLPAFKGALDEDVTNYARGTQLTLRDGAGNVVRTGDAGWQNVLTELDRYDLTITKTNGALHATFDTSRADSIPPSLTSLRALDADGHNTSVLTKGEASTLLFSAIDTVPNPTDGTVTNAAIHSMTARWRVHGTENWTPLAMTTISTEIEALAHPPAGTTFRADLSPAATTPQSIDLTFHCEDASGNAFDWTLSPALTVVDVARRRTSRH